MRGAALLVLLAALPGMGSADTESVPLTAVVTIVAAAGSDSLTADYSLSAPVTSLAFARPAPGLREQIWSVQTPGLALKDDRVVSTDGKPFDRFRLVFLPYDHFLIQNYTPLVPFSDGSRVLFTGYFDIAGEENLTYLQFEAAGLAVLLDGEPLARTQRWKSDGNGTLVYLGKAPPLTTRYAVLVMDPQLPAWVRQRLAEEIPATVKFYTDAYGLPVSHRPFLMFNWIGRDDAHAIEMNGDSLQGNVRYSLSGSAWGADTLANHDLLTLLITHELAHLWNVGLFHPDQGGSSWLAEGQAETAALETGVHFGWIDPGAARQRYSDLLNKCLGVTDTRPLSQQQGFDAVYGCGVTLNLLAEASLYKKPVHDGFFTLWRGLYAQARQNRMEYTAKGYLDAIGQLSGDSELTADMSTLMSESAAEKNKLILAELGRLGLELDQMPGKQGGMQLREIPWWSGH